MRRRAAIRRGGDWQRVPFEEASLVFGRDFDFLTLDDALTRLSNFDRRLGKIVELRFFCGLSTREVAEVLKRGESTVRQDWSMAKAWLQRDLVDAS